MPDFEFTEQQLELIRVDRSTYVEACPGAGKTQAIVQRFMDRPLAHPRKGIALISFTNAAIDEARLRCVSAPELGENPNFIGTIDGFINRFLVAPTFLARKGIAARFVESWSALPNSVVRVKGVPFSASLDWFEIDAETSTLMSDRVPIEQRAAATNLTVDNRQLLETAARKMWTGFLNRGLLSASAARVILRTYLSDEHRRVQLVSLMSSRFAEAIIDEAQDCCAEDVLVLELLRDSGVHIIAVGDPDQSIYGFRSSQDSDIAAFVGSLNPGTRLDGNFRSAPAVCAAVDSLRASTVTDSAVGNRAADHTPVVVVAYSKRKQLPKRLMKILDDHDVDHDQLVVLAHSADHARVAAGAPATSAAGGNRLVHLAVAFHAISNPGVGGAERAVAMRTVERLIREMGTEAVAAMTDSEYLDACGLTERTFREACLRLAIAVPNPFEAAPSAFRTALKEMAESQAALSWTFNSLRSPSGDTWTVSPRTGSAAFVHSTIHGLKGREAEAVAMVLPEKRAGRDGVQQWCSGEAGEERRVLYVGASRAQRLLVLAVHNSVYDLVVGQLNSDGVPVVCSGE